MNYPDWKETREGMWAAERRFPMIDDETPTFLGQPLATEKKHLEGADVVIIGSPYVSSSSDEWAGIAQGTLVGCTDKECVNNPSAINQGYVQDFRLNVFDHLKLVDYGDADIPAEANIGEA